MVESAKNSRKRPSVSIDSLHEEQLQSIQLEKEKWLKKERKKEKESFDGKASAFATKCH